MINIFKNIYSKKDNIFFSSFNDIAVDIHSHLIPNIDDGSKSNEESLEIINELKRIGFLKIITTPHTMKGGYDNTKENIENGVSRLNSFLNDCNVLNIEASSEYFGDEHLLELIKEKKLLSINNKYILFEQSFVQESATFETIIFELQLDGFKPILAHPERYGYFFDKDLKKYKEIKSKGALLQLNLFSLLGVYGEKSKLIAEKLIDDQLIDFVGTDIHNRVQIPLLELLFKNEYLYKLIQQNKLLNKTLL